MCSQFWNQTQPKIWKCDPNLIRTKTKNLEPNLTKLRFFDWTQSQTLEYFKIWNIIKMTGNYVIIVFEDKVLRNFDYHLIKSVFIVFMEFIYFFFFWKETIKILKKDLQIFWQMVFWFYRIKAEPNQNQMIS